MSEESSTRARQVLMTAYEFEQFLENENRNEERYIFLQKSDFSAVDGAGRTQVRTRSQHSERHPEHNRSDGFWELLKKVPDTILSNLSKRE